MDSFVPKSSFIEKAEYDEQSRSMTLTFKTGTQTKYLYVFPTTWLSFKQSPDHSSYYAKGIKGHIMSVPVIKKTVGRNRSSALTQIKQRRPKPNGNSILNAGINGGRKGLIPSDLT